MKYNGAYIVLQKKESLHEHRVNQKGAGSCAYNCAKVVPDFVCDYLPFCQSDRRDTSTGDRLPATRGSCLPTKRCHPGDTNFLPSWATAHQMPQSCTVIAFPATPVREQAESLVNRCIAIRVPRRRAIGLSGAVGLLN